MNASSSLAPKTDIQSRVADGLVRMLAHLDELFRSIEFANLVIRVMKYYKWKFDLGLCTKHTCRLSDKRAP